jgi:hypothetical protein
MQKNQLLKRISGVAAAVSLPMLASAGVGEQTEVGSLGTEHATGTVRLTLNLTGTLRLRVYERVAGEAPGVNNHLANGNAATNSPRDTVSFGNVTFTGAPLAGHGISAIGGDGTAFIAQLRADIYFAGASSADVAILEGTDPITDPGASAVRVTDYEFYWDCSTSATSFTEGGGTWLASGNFDSSGQGDAAILTTTAQQCFSTTTAGETVSREVDLVIFLDENAPAGLYGADFAFAANVTP